MNLLCLNSRKHSSLVLVLFVCFLLASSNCKQNSAPAIPEPTPSSVKTTATDNKKKIPVTANWENQPYDQFSHYAWIHVPYCGHNGLSFDHTQLSTVKHKKKSEYMFREVPVIGANQHHNAVRIIRQGKHWRIATWVHKDQLEDVLTEDKAVNDSSDLVAHAGARIRIKDEQPEVFSGGLTLRFSEKLPIGKVFKGPPRALGLYKSLRQQPIFASDEGDSVGTVYGTLSKYSLAETSKNRTKVQLQDGYITGSFWVNDLKEYGVGSGGGCGYGGTRGPKITIPKGSRMLFDGQTVGVTLTERNCSKGYGLSVQCPGDPSRFEFEFDPQLAPFLSEQEVDLLVEDYNQWVQSRNHSGN